MPKYEYELIEQKKKQEKKIAAIIIVTIPILMFIIGILIGIGQLNANPQAVVSQHVKTEDLCQFCFPASYLPLESTLQPGEQTTYEPIAVNFKSNYNIPECIDTISPFDLNLKVTADNKVYIDSLTLYVPLNYTVNKVQDNISKTALEYEIKPTTGASTVNILIKRTIDKLDITLNGKFSTKGEFNILPIVILKNNNKNTLPTISLKVVTDCNNQTPQITTTTTPTVTYTPTPTTTVNNTPTPTNEPESETITVTPSEVPNTGIVDSAILFTIGVVIGLGILKLRKVDLHYEKINNFFSTVYKTAYGLLIRSFGTKTYTEQKILEKVVSKKSNKDSSSSP